MQRYFNFGPGSIPRRSHTLSPCRRPSSHCATAESGCCPLHFQDNHSPTVQHRPQQVRADSRPRGAQQGTAVQILLSPRDGPPLGIAMPAVNDIPRSHSEMNIAELTVLIRRLYPEFQRRFPGITQAENGAQSDHHQADQAANNVPHKAIPLGITPKQSSTIHHAYTRLMEVAQASKLQQQSVHIKHVCQLKRKHRQQLQQMSQRLECVQMQHQDDLKLLEQLQEQQKETAEQKLNDERQLYEDRLTRLKRELSMAQTLSAVKSQEMELLALMHAADLSKTPTMDRGIQVQPSTVHASHDATAGSSDRALGSLGDLLAAELTIKGVDPKDLQLSHNRTTNAQRSPRASRHAGRSSMPRPTPRLTGKSLFGSLNVVDLKA